MATNTGELSDIFVDSVNCKIDSVDVTFDVNELKVRNRNRFFICSYDELFDSGLIQHDFKCNKKVIDLLKAGQLALSHFDKDNKLVLKYGVQGWDLFITIGIPHTLFDLDVESCNETEQLQYYKNKALKLERIIKMNGMALEKYTISKFPDNSAYTALSLHDIKRHCKAYKDTLLSVYKRISKCSTTYNEECKRQSVLCVPRDWEYILEDREDYIYVDLSEANKPALEVRKYETKTTLNIHRLFLHHRVIALKHGKQYQRLLDELSQDIPIGVLGGYESMRMLESDPLIIYLPFQHERKWRYAVNNFYRFVVHSDGGLVLKYLYSVECVAVRAEDTDACQYTVKKLSQKPCIAWIDSSKQQQKYYHEISCCSKIKQFQWYHKALSGTWSLFESTSKM